MHLARELVELFRGLLQRSVHARGIELEVVVDEDVPEPPEPAVDARNRIGDNLGTREEIV